MFYSHLKFYLKNIKQVFIDILTTFLEFFTFRKNKIMYNFASHNN